jgi:hypothetical protein
MSDSNITGVVIGLAADASIALILYYFYKRSRRAASEIQVKNNDILGYK